MRFQTYSTLDIDRVACYLMVRRISFTIDFSRSMLPQIVILEPFDVIKLNEWLERESIRLNVVNE